MKKTVLCLLLAALVGWTAYGASPAPPEAGRIRCLAVGCDRFRTMEDTTPCSANNVEIMAAVFADFLPEAEIIRRSGGPGTVGAFERLIQETFREAAEGDISYLYLSTHGVAWQEAGKTRAAFLISDGQEEEALEPERLKEMLDRIPGDKVLILDACHSGAAAEEIAGEAYRVLASGGREEDSYFWIDPNRREAGTGYFTSALEGALRASGRTMIDPDGDGSVTLKELRNRMDEIYGASTMTCGGEAETALFRLRESAEAPERILALAFDAPAAEDERLSVGFRFTIREATRLEYRVVPRKDGNWAFADAMTLPDRERTGTVRGLLSPGEKTRTIRISRASLGGEGEALLQIISLRGLHGQIPTLEASRVIRWPETQTPTK